MADTRKLPDAVVVIDMKKEALAVREARRLHIPVIGLVDTNCDPDDADFIIPGNDDAIRSSNLIVRVLADAVADGRNLGIKVADFAAETGGRGPRRAAEGGEPQAAADAPRDRRRRRARRGRRPSAGRGTPRPSPRPCPRRPRRPRAASSEEAE